MSGLLPRRAVLLAPSAAALVGGFALLTVWKRQQSMPQVWQPNEPGRVGRKLPFFASLPGLSGQAGFSSADVTATGRTVLINFFASWCMPCRQEAPVLLRLRQQGLLIWGIDYQDKPDDAVTFLKQNQDPYSRAASDATGAVGHSFALQGVPESFLVDRDGIVRWHWAGGLSEDVVRQYLDPLLRDGT
jgi:cytochrome c biogenesis protein CcmG, thiol:disulfide interchange protein DsbE